ncbi:MAG: condensation domain-containing protein, partial [Myxococcota bacterium]
APPRRGDRQEYVAPDGDSETELAAIFADVLGLERVSATASFFDLGGHSLLATSAIARIREAFAVEIELTAVFDHPTVRQLAARIASAPRAAALPPLTPAERGDAIPLSFAQRRLWLLDQLEPASRAAYAIPLAARITGALDVSALRAALRAITRRHEVLRTTIAMRDGEPVQVIDDRVRIDLDEIDLSAGQHSADPPADNAAHLSETAYEQAVMSTLRQRVRAPFDLRTGPLMRATLIRRAADRHALILVCHHVIFDAWSRGILLHELGVLYRAHVDGRPSPIAPLTVQYADFAIWQRGWLTGPYRETQLAYWRQALADAPQVLELPADRPRPSLPSYRGGSVRVAVPEPVTAGLETLARERGATLFMVLLAGFYALLHRLTGVGDLVIGTAIANRRAPQLEPLLGFFTNTLIMRSDVTGDPRFCDLVDRVRDSALAAYAHQDLPFEDLVEALPVARNLAVNPLFQVFFTLHNTPLEPVEQGDLVIEPLRQGGGSAKFDLSLLLARAEDGITGSFEYARDLFDEATVARWSHWYAALLGHAVSAPQTHLADLGLGDAALPPALPPCPLVRPQEWAQTETVHHVFEQRAAAAGQRPAVRCDG